MIDKLFITEKLKVFFNKTNIDSFLKVFIINYLFDKVSYIEKIVGYKNSLNMLDKYIYNLMNNVKSFEKLDKYHSIYARFDYEKKCVYYYMINDYIIIGNKKLSNDERKTTIINEFKIMMYKELELIVNIYSSNNRIVSNGFYIKDKNGRYPEYEDYYSDVTDILSEVEVCNILNVNNKIKKHLHEDNTYFVYSNHYSKRNSEVISYGTLWRKYIDSKLYYFAVNNPNNYSEKLIDDFNREYEYILKNDSYKFLLKEKDIFSLIESYLLHIRNRVDSENNIKYHQDLSVIFMMMNKKNEISNISTYLLHCSKKNTKMNYEMI